ncbi:hypothetical protein ACTFIY_001933 [Dictyostelium cf. discoideum]
MLKFKTKTTGGNETTVKVNGHEYLILNKESLEKLYKYILSENKNKNQRYEGWIKEYQIVTGNSNMYKVPYISGRIAPPRSFAKEPSRLLMCEKDFMTVINFMYNGLEESDKSVSRLQKTFAESPWGKNSTNNNNNYQSDEEEDSFRMIDNNDFSSENDEDDEDNEDNEKEKEVFFDTGRDSGFQKSSGSPFGAGSSKEILQWSIKVPPPPLPTTFKGKEAALKTPNSQKKRKWDDEDFDYDPEVIENLSTPVTTKIVTRKTINDEKKQCQYHQYHH